MADTGALLQHAAQCGDKIGHPAEFGNMQKQNKKAILRSRSYEGRFYQIKSEER